MTQLVNVRNLKGRAISRGKAVKEAAMFKVPLDFSSDLELTFEAAFDDIQNVYGIANVQSVKIDNSDNPDVLVLYFTNGDRITCPPYAMGIFPLLYNGGVMQVRAVSLYNVVCSIILLNTKEIAQIWTAKLPVAGTINVSGSTVLSQKSSGLISDSSVALAVAAQAIQLLPANPNRKMLAVRNPATAIGQGTGQPESIYLFFGNGAGIAPGQLGTWELLPGEQLPQFDIIHTGAVWFVADTAGHRVTAKQA